MWLDRRAYLGDIHLMAQARCLLKKMTPVILAGGQGVRLWPLSQPDVPKAFAPLVADISPFEATLLRVRDRVLYAPPVIVCLHVHCDLVEEALRKHRIDDALIIAEPVGRNTAPAIAAAALVCDADAALMVLPADHYIPDEEAFQAQVQRLAGLVDNKHIVLLGVSAKEPHTGYGYIEHGAVMGDAFKVMRFIEKPSKADAEAYVRSGQYDWNTGIFVSQASALLEAFRRHAPTVLNAVKQGLSTALQERNVLRFGVASLAACPDISIDYAVMEKLENALALPADFEWCDLGHWQALWELGDKDPNGNALYGEAQILDSAGCYVRSADIPLHVIGMQDIVAVSTSKGLFVAPRAQADRIAELVAKEGGG